MKRSRFGSVFSYHRFDDADNFRFGAVDGVIVFIFGQQPDLAVAAAQTLDGGFIAQAGHHDLTVVGGRLRTNHHLVTAENARIELSFLPSAVVTVISRTLPSLIAPWLIAFKKAGNFGCLWVN